MSITLGVEDQRQRKAHVTFTYRGPEGRFELDVRTPQDAEAATEAARLAAEREERKARRKAAKEARRRNRER